MAICNVDGCDDLAIAKSLCGLHYQRSARGFTGERLTRPSRKALHLHMLRFFAEAIFSDDDNCIIWPWSRTHYGYGVWNHRGKLPLKSDYVHRNVCHVRYGVPPDPEMDAAHRCGNGHLGCINGKHVRWATAKENAADKITHGTILRGEKSLKAVLTRDQVQNIRDSVLSAVQLGKIYGVTATHIRSIRRGQCWAWLTEPSDETSQ